MGRPTGSACDKKDGGTLIRRPDDEPDAVRNRLAVFQRQTAPVLDWYEDNDTRVIHLDATGTPGDVSTRAFRAIGT
jgi:adenylate kinase